MSKSYDQEFSEAMALKLRLNREQQSKASEKSASQGEPSDHFGGLSSLRDSIAEETIRRHPELRKEEVLEMMEAFGF